MSSITANTTIDYILHVQLYRVSHNPETIAVKYFMRMKPVKFLSGLSVILSQWYCTVS